MTPESGPESFGTFEKRAPALLLYEVFVLHYEKREELKLYRGSFNDRLLWEDDCFAENWKEEQTEAFISIKITIPWTFRFT